MNDMHKKFLAVRFYWDWEQTIVAKMCMNSNDVCLKGKGKVIERRLFDVVEQYNDEVTKVRISSFSNNIYVREIDANEGVIK